VLCSKAYERLDTKSAQYVAAKKKDESEARAAMSRIRGIFISIIVDKHRMFSFCSFVNWLTKSAFL